MYEAEIKEWQRWNKEHLGDDSWRSATLKFLLEEIQTMFDGDLEGHYWSVKWQDEDQRIAVFDVLGQAIDELTVAEESFFTGFEQNPAFFMRELADNVKIIVARH